MSVMTFQRKTARKIAGLIRRLKPAVHLIAGGYDPSLAPDVYMDEGEGAVDFIVRGEGEITFRELLRAIEAGNGYGKIAGVSYRDGKEVRHNPPRPMSRLDDIALPDRRSRVLADIRDAHEKGARAIFIVDDNITLDVKRFETLCRAIIGAGLNSID